MPDPDKALDLEILPRTVRAMASATYAAGRELVATSVGDSGKDAPLAQRQLNLTAIRSASMKLRIYLAVSGTHVIFFFIKRKRPDLRLIEATLQFSLSAVEDDGKPPPASSAISYRLVAPPHWVLQPTDEDLRRYAPRGAQAEDVILLRLGPNHGHVLGICNPERGDEARAVYTQSEPETLTIWRAEPFLELVETIRDWLKSDQTGGQEIPFDLPLDSPRVTNVHTTLASFVEGFLQIEIETLHTQLKPVPYPLSLITPAYKTDGYSAEIALTLDRKGRFATPKVEDPVSLSLKLDVTRERGELIARIALHPPDFLVTGALRDAFLDALRDGASTTAKLRQTLQLSSDDSWAEFLRSASEHAVVFRTERGSSADTDAVVLPGSYLGSPRTLILSVEATVNATVQPPEVKLSRAAFLYDSLTDTDQALDDKTASYFMRLAAALKDWLSLLR